MKSHFGVLWRYHYVIATPTTFTTCECHSTLRSLLILLLRSLPLVSEKKNLFIIFYYVHYAMVKNKQNFISALLQDAMIMKNIRFILGLVKNRLINCYYVDYAAIMAKKYIFSFQHCYIHYTVMMRKKHFSPCC